MKERFGLDDNELNELLNEGKRSGSPYIQLPKFDLDVEDLKATSHVYLSNTHWEFTIIKQNLRLFQFGRQEVW